MKVIESENSFTVVGQIECSSCGGTGLYVGMAERGGAAVVCMECVGKGCVEYKQKFNKFTGRKKRKNVIRVYKSSSHGYCVAPKDLILDNGTYVRFSKWGCGYEEWLNGQEPKPIYDLECPYQHTRQGLQCNDVNGLYKKKCSQGIRDGELISECSLRKSMVECWEIYEGKKK